MSVLNVTLGSPEAGQVKLRIASRGGANEATDFASGAKFVVTSNDPAVAPAPDASAVVLAPGITSVDVPVQVLTAGVTDFHVVETDGQGLTYEGTTTLNVNPQPAPGQASIEVSLVVVPS